MAKLRLNARRHRNKMILMIALAIVAVVGVVALSIFVIAPLFQGDDAPAAGISITKLPEKTVYFTGEVYSSKGMVVEMISYNGTKTEIPIEQCKITGFDSSVPATSQTIRVSYQGYSATYTVTINKMPRPEKEPLSVEIGNPPKTEYKLSELSAGINVDGGTLLVTYVDGTTDEVEMDGNWVFGLMGIREVGSYDLTVEYIERGVRVTTTYTITVTE